MLSTLFGAARRATARGGLAATIALLAASGAGAQTPWPSGGATVDNTRAVLSAVGPNQLNPTTAKQLKVKWSFVTNGDVSATPTVEPGGLYVPDWGGMLWKLNPTTGAVIWSHPVSYYTGDKNSKSRSSPAIVGNAIIIGDMSVARVIAVNKTTGELLWKTSVDSNSDAFASTSPTVYNGIVYFGIASREETTQHPPSGGFRGSVVALNASTGALLWRFITVPVGYTGGAVVSAPVVDAARGSLYIAADNNYSIPNSVETCIKGVGVTDEAAQLNCMDPSNYVDAIVALDLKTGALKWGRRFSGADTWTVVCNSANGCLQPPGNDYDFASSPNMLTVTGLAGASDDRGGTSNGVLLGAGQKNGYYIGLNPANGGVIWTTLVGRGGIQWGSAVDLDNHGHIYVALKNDAHRTNTLTDFYGHQTQWAAGAWAQLDAVTGKMVWQIPAMGQDMVNPKLGASAPGAVTFTNNVMFAGASSGYMTALSARTGYVLWSFQSGGSVWSGPAIFNDWVYWGTGYGRLGGQGYNRLYAFSFQ